MDIYFIVFPTTLVVSTISLIFLLSGKDKSSVRIFSENEKETLKTPFHMDSQNIGFTLLVPHVVVHLYSPFESHDFPSL